MKDISIIIINYNTSEYTIQSVLSIFEKTSTKLNYDIVVVDNNSEKKDYLFLKNNLPKKDNLKLIRSPINLGFGGGNMFGTQSINSKYLLFLNNDAFFINDCLSILFDFMENSSDIGVSTAQNYDENNNFVSSFDHNKGLRKLLFGRGFLEYINPKEFPKRKQEYKKPINVNFVNGAFMFFNTKAFAEVGGFDTNIFLYFEEMDICYRLKNLGYKSALVPSAKITHIQGASTGTSKNISKEGLISYLYITKKNYVYLKYLFILIYFCITFLFKPKKWFLLPLVLKGAPIHESLKQKQKLNVHLN